MKDLHRAMLSLTRRKGKTLILFIVIFILGNVIAGSIAINQATKKSEQQLKSQLGSAASISLDYQKLMNEGYDFSKPLPELSETQIKEIGQRPEVKTFDYSITDSVIGKEIKRVEVEKNENGGIVVMTGSDGPTYMLTGVNDPKVMEIEEGKSTLVEGRVFTENEILQKEAKALVSKEFAEENNLHVGDTFMTKRDLYDPEELLSTSAGSVSNGGMPPVIASQDYPIEIIGIFEPKMENQKKNDATGMSAFMNEEKLNSFYVPNGFIADMLAWDKAKTIELKPNTDVSNIRTSNFTPTYILKSPDDFASFEEAVKATLPEGYKLETSSDSYKEIAAPLESLKSMSDMTLIVSIAAGLAIIGLIMMLFLRDRKHEMGIYLSLGAPKIRVITQIVAEVFIIGFIAITISLGTGNLVARSVSDTMIQNQQLQALENQNNGEMVFSLDSGVSSYGEDITEEEVIDAYSVTLTPRYIITFYLVGLGTILISTLIPVLYFTRMNPKKIML